MIERPLQVTMATEIRIDKLVSWSPFDLDVWGTGRPITISEVRVAIKDGRLMNEPWEEGYTRQNHIERVAYLVMNKDVTPIQIDVGVPALNAANPWIVEDGNHRLAAAIYRGDEVILAEVSGQVNYAADLLGIPKSAIADSRVESNGETVWVNSGETGTCIGRFGKAGIDIHHDIEAQMKEGKQCLNCTHHKPTNEDWTTFVQGMKQHYDVEVGEEHKPTWLNN